jgi:predicted protein tyrosine phosphatase
MEKKQLSRLRRGFARHVTGKKLVCLDIADNYDFMEDALVAILLERIARVGP